MEAAITNYEGTSVSLQGSDRNGKITDVVLEYDKLEDFEQGKAYFGETIGRYGNRIAHGKFTLDGVAYTPAERDKDTVLRLTTIVISII